MSKRIRLHAWRTFSFGFVSFATSEESTKAIQLLNGRDLDGREIEVKEAESKPSGDRPAPRNNFGGGGGGGGAGVCYAFQKGDCTRGSSCRFSHEGGGGGGQSGGRGGDRDRGHNDRGGDRYEERPRGGGGGGVCYSFQKGECTRGSSCRFSHEGAGDARKKSKYDDE